jgi:hypothetical protein
MTRLQLASRTGKLEAKSGAFESSFAAGLDLSEFGLPSKRQESAAAELLCIKMEVSCQASQEEQEERLIQEEQKQRRKSYRVLSWKNMAVDGTRHHRRHTYMVAFCCQFRRLALL